MKADKTNKLIYLTISLELTNLNYSLTEGNCRKMKQAFWERLGWRLRTENTPECDSLITETECTVYKVNTLIWLFLIHQNVVLVIYPFSYVNLKNT